MSAPPTDATDPRTEHLDLARRQRHAPLAGADLARYRALHQRQLVELLSGPGRVLLTLAELEAIEARGGAIPDLPRAVALGRAWRVAWDGGEPLLCEGASGDEVLCALAGVVAGDEAHEHEGGAEAWARARGWVARQVVGMLG